MFFVHYEQEAKRSSSHVESMIQVLQGRLDASEREKVGTSVLC
jgi:hypothetical protein